MGLLDFFRPPPEPQTPDELRDALIAAYRRKKWKWISSLCERHEQTIQEHFAAWRTVPESIRNNRRAVDDYVQTMIKVGQAFQSAGQPELLQLMLGDEESNPLLTWGDDLQKAQALIDAEDYQAAIELLTQRLQRHEGHKGTGMDYFLPRTYGMLGIAHFRAGELIDARKHTLSALAVCQEVGDAEGVKTYTENLRQMGAGA